MGASIMIMMSFLLESGISVHMPCNPSATMDPCALHAWLTRELCPKANGLLCRGKVLCGIRITVELVDECKL